MKRIVNFGSLNLDYVYSVDRIVQPGETISSREMKIFCGGKGLNQSAAITKAGGEVFHAGRYGRNDGRALAEALSSSGVNTLYLEPAEGVSGHAIIQVDSAGQNSILLFGGANQAFTADYIDRVLENFGDGDILLIQNEINLLPYIIRKAKDRNMTIAFNPSPMDEKVKKYPLELVDIFILNEIEGREMTGRTDADDICDTLLEMFQGCEIVLTLGKDGCVYCKGETRLRQDIYKVKAVDTTAAGDTFTGYYLAAMISGMGPATAIKRASAASAIAVGRAGAFSSIPDITEVERFLAEQE